MIEILSGGILSTIQDQGRYGFRRYGVPISGAMDRYALRVANALVGNQEDAAGIEVTFYGLKLRSTNDVCISVTGGDLSPQIDRDPIPTWTSICLKRDKVLSFPRLRAGFRAYVAVRGGVEVPLIMNSRSTMVKAFFGGTGGPLKAGDRLKVGEIFAAITRMEKALPERFIPIFSSQMDISVLLGPQADYFSSDTLDLFLNSEYTITSQSDRQGYRLKGPELRHLKSYEIITEAMWPGAVEIPGDGLPIILLSDAQTTGGYPKIGSVIAVDLDTLGQAKPSDTLRFKSITLEESLDRIKKREDQLREIKTLAKQ